MAIITWLRRLSVLCLVLTVTFGAVLIDKRFTVLLVPPYLMYWASENDISQIPVLRFANHTWARIPLVLLGLAVGFGINYVIGGGSLSDLLGLQKDEM